MIAIEKGTPDVGLSLYHLLDPEVLANPYPLYRRLREEAPVHWDPYLHTWVVTRYEDVVTVLHRFSANRTPTPEQLEAIGMGESDPENTSSTAGAMHRAWINLKSAITSQDDHAILAECERGEDSAISEYKKAMESNDLTSPIRDTISRQYTDVKAAHDRVKALRDASKNN